MELKRQADLSEIWFEQAIEQFLQEYKIVPNTLRCGRNATFIGCKMFEVGIRRAVAEIYGVVFTMQYDPQFKEDEWQVERANMCVHSLGA